MKIYKLNNKEITINDKNYLVVMRFKDKIYGEIVKAISTTLQDFERIYFLKFDEGYVKVEDKKILEYIKEHYEKMSDDIIG